MTNEELITALGNLTAPQLVELTKQLEQSWGVQATPQMGAVQQTVQQEAKPEQTEFTVVLMSVPADKKMAVVKMVRELTGMGLMESKTLVETVPKNIKESVSKEDAESLKDKLTSAGAVVELK